jgi:ribosome-associated protein
MKYQVTPSIRLDEDSITFDFIRSSAPGGQNVNKVSSAVELRFASLGAQLPEMVRQRLIRLAGRRMAQDGTLVLKAQRFRSQERNRADALERLFALIRQAAIAPIPRRPTRPTLGSKQRRLTAKRVNKIIKNNRGPVDDPDA